MYIYSFLLLLTPFFLFGQTTDLYPDALVHTYLNNSHLNPSYFQEAEKYEITAQYKSRLAPLNTISTVSLTAGKYFKIQNHVAQVLRLQVLNEREGSYIQRPRVAAEYAYRLRFNENWSVALGLRLGFVQFNVSAPSATTTGSATAPDGAIGGTTYFKQHRLGIAIQQFFNASTQPVNGIVQYPPFCTVFYSGKWNIRSTQSLKYQLSYRSSSGLGYNWLIHSQYSFSEKIDIGTTLYPSSGIAFHIQFSIPTTSVQIRFALSYFSPLGKNTTSFAPIMETAIQLVE